MPPGQLQHWSTLKDGAPFLCLLSLYDVVLVASVKNFIDKHSAVGKLDSGPWDLGILRNNVTSYMWFEQRCIRQFFHIWELMRFFFYEYIGKN